MFIRVHPWQKYSSFFLLAFCNLHFAFCTEESSAISILSVLKPTELTITLLSSEPSALRVETDKQTTEVALHKGSVLHVQIAGKGLRMRNCELRIANYESEASRVSIRCPEGCRLQLTVPGRIERVYHGDLALTNINNTINIVLSLSKEELIASITASEMGEFREPEAFKAFAVPARTFAGIGRRHPERQADLCDTTHCQVFQGFVPQKEVLDAVQATAGLVLTYQRKMFRPYYSRSCGGKTATFQEIWQEEAPDYPFFSVPCSCAQNPASRWTSEVGHDSLALITGISNPRIEREASTIVFTNGAQKAVYTPENLRILIGRMLGWKALPGNQFEVKEEREHVLFSGTGIGHRVGLCQIGAAEMAARGKSFLDILGHYFPNTEIRPGG